MSQQHAGEKGKSGSTPMSDDKGTNKRDFDKDKDDDEIEQEVEYVRYIKTIKRFEADSSGDIDYEEALEYFRRYQILHIRTCNNDSSSSTEEMKSFGPVQLQELFEKFPSELKLNYNVENLVGQEDLTIDQVFTKKREKRRKGS